MPFSGHFWLGVAWVVTRQVVRVVVVVLEDQVEAVVVVLPLVSVVMHGWSDLLRCSGGLVGIRLVVSAAPSLLPCPL